MNFLPIARLEMRAAARNPLTYHSRCLTALVAAAVGLGFVFAGFTRAMRAGPAGQALFSLMAAIVYVLLAAQALLLTCDCISREKREGTLGLLFLTDLNGFDIVIGKMAAQAGRSLSGLMAVIPIFGFCILLGGVGAGDFAAVAAALLNTLFYFAALGILISACAWRAGAASACGGLALLGLGILLPVASLMLDRPALAIFVPGGATLAALSPAQGWASPWPFGFWLLGSHLLGWIFIIAASWLAPRSVTREPKTNRAKSANTVKTINAWRYAPPPWMTQPGQPLFTVSIMALICIVVLSAACFGPGWVKTPAVPLTILLLHAVLKFQMASQAGRLLAGKRHNGELELLLTTPYDEEQILRDCLLGLKRSLFKPTLFALGVDVLLLGFIWLKNPWDNGLGWMFLLAVEAFWLVLNLYGLAWVGLYLGLRLANPARAAGQALFYVVLLPWVVFCLLSLLSVALIPGHRFDGGVVFTSALIFAVAVVVCNTFFSAWAVTELRDHLRTLAAKA